MTLAFEPILCPVHTNLLGTVTASNTLQPMRGCSSLAGKDPWPLPDKAQDDLKSATTWLENLYSSQG